MRSAYRAGVLILMIIFVADSVQSATNMVGVQMTPKPHSAASPKSSSTPTANSSNNNKPSTESDNQSKSNSYSKPSPATSPKPASNNSPKPEPAKPSQSDQAHHQEQNSTTTNNNSSPSADQPTSTPSPSASTPSPSTSASTPSPSTSAPSSAPTSAAPTSSPATPLPEIEICIPGVNITAKMSIADAAPILSSGATYGPCTAANGPVPSSTAPVQVMMTSAPTTLPTPSSVQLQTPQQIILPSPKIVIKPRTRVVRRPIRISSNDEECSDEPVVDAEDCDDDQDQEEEDQDEDTDVVRRPSRSLSLHQLNRKSILSKPIPAITLSLPATSVPTFTPSITSGPKTSAPISANSTLSQSTERNQTESSTELHGNGNSTKSLEQEKHGINNKSMSVINTAAFNTTTRQTFNTTRLK